MLVRGPLDTCFIKGGWQQHVMECNGEAPKPYNATINGTQVREMRGRSWRATASAGAWPRGWRFAFKATPRQSCARIRAPWAALARAMRAPEHLSSTIASKVIGFRHG